MDSGLSFRNFCRFAGMTSAVFAVCLVGTLPAQEGAVETAPEFTPPPLSSSLLDFVTGLPVSYNAKLMATPKLLRPPFAGAPVDTAKGLASKIKAQQVDAKNRAAAAKFLGTVDCVAYPEAQEQLIKLVKEDPVEEVRYAAAKALRNQLARGKACHPTGKQKRRFDQCRGCCPGQEVMNDLAKRAYEYGDYGCPLEPSDRVRQAIAEALNQCCHYCCEHMTYDEEVSPEPVEEETAPAVEEEDQKPAEEKPAIKKPVEKPPVPPAENPRPQAKQAAGPQIQPIKCEEQVGYPEVACLRGYCPVAMQQRRLVPARKEYTSMYGGFTYHFSSLEAKRSFDRSPEQYAPVLGGIDIVLLKRDGQRATGTFFANYKGRPYWFAQEETRKVFLRCPAQYAEIGH